MPSVARVHCYPLACGSSPRSNRRPHDLDVSPAGSPTPAARGFEGIVETCCGIAPGTVAEMAKVLVTGMSGTGKSSVLVALDRRGHRVVDTDDPGWTEWAASPQEQGGGEWLWLEERMTALLRIDDPRTLFVQGCVRNQAKFYDRFDAIVLLSAPAEVILDRIAQRTTNNYGKAPVEQELILHQLATVEPMLRTGCTHELDASRPLNDLVADLIAISEGSA
jgi:shikimate kinase